MMIKDKIWWAKAPLPQMNELYQNLFAGGKGLRASLTQEVATSLKIPKAQQESLSRIVEYIHQSSLLHDDVIDASPVRRGSLSSWRQYSMKKAVLAGDYLLAESAEEATRLNNIPLMQLTSQTLKKLVKGEWLQAEIKGQENTDSLEKVHELKTSGLFQWSLRAPFLLKNQEDKNLHKRLNTIGRLMGILFQRADDLLDFDIRNKEGKNTFKDLEENSFNSFALQLLKTTQAHLSTKSSLPYVNGAGQALKYQSLKCPKSQLAHLRSVLKLCRSLKEVKQAIHSVVLESALQEFDKVSTQYIKNCQKEVQRLTLPEPEEPLKEKLKKWSEKLYWRR